MPSMLVGRRAAPLGLWPARNGPELGILAALALALAVGTTLLGSGFAAESRRVDVETALGTVSLLDAGDFLMLQRHGLDRYVGPARDRPSRATCSRSPSAACDRILAIGSSRLAAAEIAVGTLLAPDDFVALRAGPRLYDDARGHLVPGLDAQWRATVIEAWHAGRAAASRRRRLLGRRPGPRFETPAEVRMIAAHADVVGMTMASECVIAGELGISYAAVCAVDNLANGIGAQPLTVEEFEAGKAANAASR